MIRSVYEQTRSAGGAHQRQHDDAIDVEHGNGRAPRLNGTLHVRDVDHQNPDGTGEGNQSQDGPQGQTLGFRRKPFAIGRKVDGPSDVLPHDKEHGGDEDVVFDVEGVKIVEAAGEHGASAGAAVTLRLGVN